MALGNGNTTQTANGGITNLNEKSTSNNRPNVETLTKTNRQADPNTSFLRAARAGHLDKIQEFLDSGTIRDINTSNANGLNALHLASKDGHIEVVKELLKRGAVVDAATKKGNTSLHIASLAGQEEVVRTLVQHGASINVQSQSGFTPLYMAAQENHDAVVRFLLSKGANQALATEDGFTPLAVAMQQGHDKVVAVLLEHDTRGKVRLPALHIAAKKDDVKAATLLLENDHNPDVTSKSGFTPLHIAAHYGNESIANLLVQKGADVNFAAKHNITPLHVAAKWGKAKMVELLLDRGASIEAKTRDGLTPLHCAARSGHENVVEILLNRHAPISSKTKNGLAPLHMAAQGDHVKAASVLLKNGAPVDDVTVDYLTSLHVASHCGHVAMAKLLLEKNADPNSRALNGFTALHIACKKNRIKIVEMLLKHGAYISATTESGLTSLHVASFMGCMNIVMFLLQNDANPDIPTIRGETPLHLAARANQTDIIRILLRNGACVDAKAREQQTPLHVASRLGNTEIVVLLLQHGAQPDAPTSDYYTPLHIAAKEGQEEVASILLDHNASLTATTKKGFTPLHLASKYGHLNVAKLIISRGIALEKEHSTGQKMSRDEIDSIKNAPSEIVDAPARNLVTPLHVAAHYDKQPVALLLLESGAQPQAAARNGHTPLHIASKKNQLNIANTLLEHGASANVESKAGFTPLHLSVQDGHNEMTELLIENDAEVNHSAKNGLTPLHLAAQYDRQDSAKILLSKGADPNAKTKTGYTPLHVASHYGNANMVKLLLENGAEIDSNTEMGYTPLHQAAQQGHTLIINILLKNKADPNATTQNGQTALSIANKLGYVTVVETLKVVTTETTITSTITSTFEEKYRVVAPEAMHDTFMSDSEDEGGGLEDMAPPAMNIYGQASPAHHLYLSYYQRQNMTCEDPLLSDQQHYNYMTVDDMKNLGDDSMRLDVTHDEKPQPHDTKYQNGDIQKETYHGTDASHIHMNLPADNADLAKHQPIHAGFLVSFLVDARGGAMRGCRHSGIRVIVPPRAASSPTRVTCRYVRSHRPNATSSPGPICTSTPPPLPLCEGEALASRILELGPVGAKFLGPVILEVPHFASLRGIDREILILRSDSGDSWREHSLDTSNEAAVQDVLQDTFEGDELSQLEDLPTSRIVRILTTELPRYIAVLQRNRQDSGIVGPEGGTLSCRTVPQAQAIFPPNALTKRIRVGLQAQPIDPALVCRVLGKGGVAVSPVLTVEPRRRKFHRAITLGLPAPKAHSMGMINQYQSGTTPTLRLLCSITGGQNPAVWEDVTGSTPLTFVKDCVTFTTTVSARFWLMDCRNAAESTRYATELYKEANRPPFMAKFVVFAKRTEVNEAFIRVFCMTDDKEDKTLETQENFIEVAKSKDVEVLEDKPIYLEVIGNLIAVTKSGEQLNMSFHSFQENRLAFTMKIKNLDDEPIGRILFMSEPKAPKGEPAQTPICTLNIGLPQVISEKSRFGSTTKIVNGLSESSDSIHRADISLAHMSRLLDADWLRLAHEIDPPLTATDIDLIKSEFHGDVPKQASVMLRLWLRQAGPKATGNNLAKALNDIGRSDIVDRCIGNLELVSDNSELLLAHTRLDNADHSAFDDLKNELGIPMSSSSRDSTLERKTNQMLDTFDKSGFDAFKNELMPSSNNATIASGENELSDLSNTINDYLQHKNDLNEKSMSYYDTKMNKLIENTDDSKPALKSILKKDRPHDDKYDKEKETYEESLIKKETIVMDSPAIDQVDDKNRSNLVDMETIAMLTEQLDKIPSARREGVGERIETPPPSPFYTYGENREPVEEVCVKVIKKKDKPDEALFISEAEQPQEHYKEEIIIETKSSKIPSAIKTSTPVKVKTIKKHTKLSKEFTPQNTTTETRPSVDQIEWDITERPIEPEEKAFKEFENNFKNDEKQNKVQDASNIPVATKSSGGGKSRKSKSKRGKKNNSVSEDSSPNESPEKKMNVGEKHSEVIHSNETIIRSPIQVKKVTMTTKVKDDGVFGHEDDEFKSKINEEVYNVAGDVIKNLEQVVDSFANESQEAITRKEVEIGPKGEKITRIYKEYPDVQKDITILTETGPNGEKIIKKISGSADLHPELLKKLMEQSEVTTTTKTMTEIGPNGERVTKTVTCTPNLEHEISLKTCDLEPKINRVVTEVRDYEPSDSYLNVKVSPKSKIPVLISEKKQRTESDDDEDDLRASATPNKSSRVIGSSSGSDVALHEGLSDDETDDIYQNEPTFTENIIEETDPITGAKITRTIRTVTQQLSQPAGNRDVTYLRGNMQQVLDNFINEEQQNH